MNRSGQDTSDGASRQAGGDAYDRIFLAGERLFAEFGYEGVSVRDIVQAGGVNLAAVSYHFGSKHDLLIAIFAKRIRELDQERADLLRAAERAHNGAPPVEAILRAYLTPATLWRCPAGPRANSIRFIYRLAFAPTPKLRALLESRVKGLALFRESLARAAPGASAEGILWSLHFVAMLSYHGADLPLKRLETLAEGGVRIDDLQGDIDRTVQFAVAGFARLCGSRSDAG